MKAQLIVVQGKPEGKVIPLVGTSFKIGRGEGCQLRPASDQVSREHVEFTVDDSGVTVADLGSRNGTKVNGKLIKTKVVLKNRDLVEVGPLTFAVSIEGLPVSAQPALAPSSVKAAPEDVAPDEIDSWLVSDGQGPAPERPSGIYGGETIQIETVKEKPAAAAAQAAPTPPPVEESEAAAGEEAPEEIEESEEEESEDEDAEEQPEEMMDESNPFYVKKKPPEAPTKPVYKDTSDAASDILRKMMDRRRSR